MSIDSLLASPEFADLRAMAATQVRMLAEIGSAAFLEPNLSIPSKELDSTGTSAVADVVSHPNHFKTTILLLDGPAGIGKTRLLQRVTWESARAYVAGEDRVPILYVGSRGARLSNLRNELAATTQRLRARFTFEQVPVLVRRGLIALAIDGFDELVDADGYHDAWFALRDFLDELSSGGVCILAGRDTFFDQQGFLTRLERMTTTVDLVQGHLQPIAPRVAMGWLSSHGWNDSDISSPEALDVLQPDSYALRPYFLSVLAGTRGWAEVTNKTSIREYLVEKFIDREAVLIENMIGGLTSASVRIALTKILEEAALDMAERESTEVDVEYLGLLCELAFENMSVEEDIRKLQHKAGSLALLEKGASERVRRFPHSEIHNHFLASAVLRDLTAGTIPAVLRRGVLGTDFLEVFQDVIEREPARVKVVVASVMQPPVEYCDRPNASL